MSKDNLIKKFLLVLVCTLFGCSANTQTKEKLQQTDFDIESVNNNVTSNEEETISDDIEIEWDTAWNVMTKEEQEDLSLYGYDTSDTFIEFDQKTIDTRILQHITKGKEYTSGKKYSDRFMIMVDMGIHSGKNRMFVYDLNQKKVIKKMLVSHGCGDHTWGVDYTRNNPKFSNVPNSHLSSLGKYKIGKRGYSNWGINVNYKLHGLDATNNNAFRRVVVLHSWNDVTDEEVYPDGAVEGYGCPAVSNNNMKYLDSLLKKEDKAVLMWIYQ